MSIRIASFVLGIVVCSMAWGQAPKMQPGEAHRRLDFLVGDWTLASKMYMADRVHSAEHTAEIRWLPGGVWLEERTEMRGTPIGDLFGTARIAWDRDRGEYVRYWIDNQSHVSLPMRGRFVDASTLEFSGSFEWIDGTVFHQRLVIRKEDGGSWSQTGHMGRTPDALRMNHEEKAMRREPTAKPPGWFVNHLEFMAGGSGRWIADNAAYRSEQEPLEAYGTEWTWGPGKKSLRGRLFGMADGEEAGTFWELRVVWHPGEGRAIAYQYGTSGAMGVGPMEPAGPGSTRMEQTFYGPDGSRSVVGHDSTEVDEDTHLTKSFDVLPDGSRKPRRTYTWRRQGDRERDSRPRTGS